MGLDSIPLEKISPLKWVFCPPLSLQNFYWSFQFKPSCLNYNFVLLHAITKYVQIHLLNVGYPIYGTKIIIWMNKSANDKCQLVFYHNVIKWNSVDESILICKVNYMIEFEFLSTICLQHSLKNIFDFPKNSKYVDTDYRHQLM